MCALKYIVNIISCLYLQSSGPIPYNFIQGNQYPLVPDWVLRLMRHNQQLISVPKLYVHTLTSSVLTKGLFLLHLPFY